MVVLGPYEYTTAIIIRLNSTDGIVRIISSNKDVSIYYTHLDVVNEVEIVFLLVSYFYYVILDA